MGPVDQARGEGSNLVLIPYHVHALNSTSTFSNQISGVHPISYKAFVLNQTVISARFLKIATQDLANQHKSLQEYSAVTADVVHSVDFVRPCPCGWSKQLHGERDTYTPPIREETVQSSVKLNQLSLIGLIVNVSTA